MMILVLGKPGSGKSEYAEKLAVESAGGKPKLYLATMIPFGEEGAARIKRHREMRSGKGFDTIERADGLDGLRDELIPYEDGVCLLECVANLAGNEMHAPANAGLGTYELTELVTGEICRLADKVRELIVVSDIFEITDECDDETKAYIRLVHDINDRIKSAADRVYEL